MALLHIDESSAGQLLKKWQPMLDYSSDRVRPIENDNTRLNTAILMENELKWCQLNEANIAGSAGSVFGSNVTNTATNFTGDNYATGDARLPKVLIPMLRRTFPELITNEIVGVQPMSGPVGLAFAMRYKYESEALGATNANGSDGSLAASTKVGDAQAISDGREIGYNYLNTAFTGASSTALSGLSGVWDALAENAGVAALVSQFEMSSKIPQVTLEFSKTSVEAGTRKLAAKWSVELEQDLKAMMGIDVDSELTNAMSYEIQAEIDREMINRMIQVCLKAGSGVGFSVWSAASADGRWGAERARDFYNRLVVESNRIAIRNRRGPANFIIATPRICAILESIPGFQFWSVPGTVNTNSVGIARVGNIGGNRFQVYRDTRLDTELNAGYNPAGAGYSSTRKNPLDYALLGYKGPDFYDTGIIYCPYIPVMVQRTIAPNDMSPRVGLMTRYGVVDNIWGAHLYYHLLICTGLGTAFQPGQTVVYL